TVDIRPALNAFIKPNGPLLQASALKSQATARCSAGHPELPGTSSGAALALASSGNPDLQGSSSVASLSILGFSLPADEELDKTLQAVDSQSLDPSNIDVSKVLAPTADLTALQLALQPVLDSLPTITIPPTEVHVKVT